MGSSAEQDYDYSFKILLIGDSGVGKSCLIQSFMSHFVDNRPPTLGTDFQIKYLTVGGTKLKLTIWDTGLFELSRIDMTSYTPTFICSSSFQLTILLTCHSSCF
ncbi:ras-related protein RABC2a-like [Musa troglodytarum]|uniref:Ras-related protein RABC2a-like n=1 Tax=Musa troglodytarum TaxID=320322 RepID=A0A9E7FUJ4_9LILI|nr:ras-related protein RABC2a-like [Musa troglodytarum]